MAFLLGVTSRLKLVTLGFLILKGCKYSGLVCVGGRGEGGGEAVW